MKKLIVLLTLILSFPTLFAKAAPVVFKFDTSRLQDIDLSSLWMEYQGGFCSYDDYKNYKCPLMFSSGATDVTPIFVMSPAGWPITLSRLTFSARSHSNELIISDQVNDDWSFVAPKKESCNITLAGDYLHGFKTYESGTYNVVFDYEPKMYRMSNPHFQWGYWLSCEITKE